jgi:NADPH-dependent curcumin reductase CurA
MARPTDIPDYSLPSGNRRVLLARRPTGVPQPGDFSIDAAAIPAIGPDQFLVRNIYLSVDPAQRGWASAEANYSQPVALGSPMRGLAVGVVVRSNDPSVAEGEFVYGWFGWQDYVAANAGQILVRARAAVPLSAYAGLLGINGLTAYLALTALGHPVAGDTLLVSTAAGSVGGFVGQIGKIRGCRTIGLTGDDAKVERCRARYGYDEAFNYRTSDLDAVLPRDINVYFDNTGGAILDVALRRMAVGGRIVQCGTAANQIWTPLPTGPRNEREILTRRLVWSGFVIFDYAASFDEAGEQLAAWWSEGRLTYDEDISGDIAEAPGAIGQLYAGANTGKKLIYIG